jgi:hypothetical protein
MSKHRGKNARPLHNKNVLIKILEENRIKLKKYAKKENNS